MIELVLSFIKPI